MKTDTSLIVIIITLIAYGCPMAAITAAFGFQGWTIRDWLLKAGTHSREIHEALVLRPRALGHVQADEIFVRSQSEGSFLRGRRWLYLFSAICVSTSYIERLNATFRGRLAVLSRRTRHLARTRATLEASLYLLGAVYNFCSAHGSLGSKSTVGRTPAMAAGLTQHIWTVGQLLWHRIPPERWRPPVHRGPLSKREQALLAQWGE